EWDRGNEYFQPTSFQVSNIHADAGANNVIPGQLTAAFNFRFSPASPMEELKERVHRILEAHGLDYEIAWSLTGAPFMTAGGRLTDALSAAVRDVTGRTPELSTGGGTSDGRFLAVIAREVVEFGPLNDTIHKIDERIRLADVGPLSLIY